MSRNFYVRSQKRVSGNQPLDIFRRGTIITLLCGLWRRRNIHPILFSSFINSKETQQATKRSLDINVTYCLLCLVEVPCTHSIENVGPAHSAATTELREHGVEFTAEDFDGNDLTGGNLKLLTRSLKALTRDDKPEELDVALDVRPTLVQASNLLVRRQ